MKRRSIPFAVVIICLILAVELQAQQTMRVLVHPFKNTGQKKFSWISPGMTETVISDLGRVPGIDVISEADRKSAMKEIAAGQSGLIRKDHIQKTGQLLGANIIFTGSYAIFGNKIRVFAKLVNIDSGNVMKTAKVTGLYDNLFDVQDQITIKLLSHVRDLNIKKIKKINVTNKDIARIKDTVRTNKNAYEWYSKGLEVKFTNTRRAISFFKKAISMDSNFVDAMIQIGYLEGFEVNNFNKGLSYLQSADNILMNRNETITVRYADLKSMMGLIYWRKESNRLSIQSLNQCRNVLSQLGLRQSARYAVYLNNLGQTYWGMRKYDKCERSLFESQNLFMSLGLTNTTDYAVLLKTFGNFYNEIRHQIDKALGYHIKAKSILDRLGMVRGPKYANQLHDLGVIYEKKRRYRKANGYYFRAKRIRDKIGLQGSLIYGHNLWGLGFTTYKMGNTNKAGQYYRSAYRIYLKIMGPNSSWTKEMDKRARKLGR